MRYLVVIAAIVAAVALTVQPASAQVSGQMVGSRHDLGTGGGTTLAATNVDRVCAFCHTPHQAASASAQDPLWNHTLSSTASYGVYGSATLNAVPTDIGGATPGTAAVSNLCMSCHDGTVAVGSLYNDPNIGTPDNSAALMTGTANLGTSLVDDHPVNFTFDGPLATADGGLVTPNSTASVDAGGIVPLFSGTVQCASCHDPHLPTNNPFLVMDNANSNLCSTCHLK